MTRSVSFPTSTLPSVVVALRVTSTELAEASIKPCKSARSNFMLSPEPVTRTFSAGTLVQLTPPVLIKPHPIKAEGSQRMAGLEVTNNTGKAIEAVSVGMFFINEESAISRSVPHKETWTLGNPDGSLAEGESRIINVFSAFMRKVTASVGAW